MPSAANAVDPSRSGPCSCRGFSESCAELDQKTRPWGALKTVMNSRILTYFQQPRETLNSSRLIVLNRPFNDTRLLQTHPSQRKKLDLYLQVSDDIDINLLRASVNHFPIWNIYFPIWKFHSPDVFVVSSSAKVPASALRLNAGMMVASASRVHYNYLYLAWQDMFSRSHADLCLSFPRSHFEPPKAKSVQ